MRHLDAHNILSDQQLCFQKKRSCDSQLILTLQDLSAGLEAGEQIDAVLLDFSKAFDKVSHQRLSLKLRHYGISSGLKASYPTDSNRPLSKDIFHPLLQ